MLDLIDQTPTHIAPQFPPAFINQIFVYQASDALSNWLHHHAPDEVRELYSVHMWATEYIASIDKHNGVTPSLNSEVQLQGGLWLMDALRQYWDADHPEYLHVRPEFNE